MSQKSEPMAAAGPAGAEAAAGPAANACAGRKTFVEPEISQPVDVLEATTFFQTATSDAGTN